jgi:hypothetical protein
MTLQLHQLMDQIKQAGLQSADRARERRARLPESIHALHQAAADPELPSRVKQATRIQWRGAIPTQEKVDRHVAAPSTPPCATIVAVDGSQVYPDPHGPSLYYALNMGYFIVRLGKGETDSGSAAELVFDESRLCPGGEILPAAALNARRSIEELALLSSLCLAELGRPSAPLSGSSVLGLLDGSLAINLRREGIRVEERSQLERRYLSFLDQLGQKEIPVAGYVARPWGSPVLSLLALARIDSSDLESYIRSLVTSRSDAESPDPFRALSDRVLFAELLKPGERSALFEHGAEANELFRQAVLSHFPGTSHSTHFFYVNVGHTTASVARLDIPEWVARSERMVETVHALVLDQCHVTLSDPYPYALIRADEEAVVRGEEKEALEAMIRSGLMAEGLEAEPSEKLAQKWKARYRNAPR